MVNQQQIITLLTDFGIDDHYVAVMKGVILSISPNTKIIDISHTISPHDISKGSLILRNAYRYFPPETIHVVVIDPGVGSPRKPIAIKTTYGTFIAPDNGVLSGILESEDLITAVSLENPTYQISHVSNTFHGRDIFSPAAAYLSKGLKLSELGPELADLIRIDYAQTEISQNIITGEIQHIDHFGNAVSNIGEFHWMDDDLLELQPASGEELIFNAHHCSVTINDKIVSGIQKSYSSVRENEALALIGSTGKLEIAINRGDASKMLHLRKSDIVTINYKD